MILIADSGSTKADWVVLDSKHEMVKLTQTIGFNPYFVNSNFTKEEILKNADLNSIKDEVDQIYFYGAGCSSSTNQAIIKEGLKLVFPNADILVDHDLKAAAYAAYRGEPVLVCIIGTGSNACYFDGKVVYEEAPSLAYILGDEASGNWLGKQVIRGYFYKTMPEHLRKEFEEEYGLDIYEVNDKVYNNPRGNAFLASFSTFVGAHKEDPYFRDIVYKGFQEFFDYQIKPFGKLSQTTMNFIGSIAHYYEDILRECAADNGLIVGEIIRKPIHHLVDYHVKYILK